MTEHKYNYSELLAKNGLLEKRLNHFTHRPGQLQMATYFASAVDQGQRVLLEASAGSGKTYAYLLPIICRGQSAVISTASHYLQQQLFSRDIPELLNCLSAETRAGKSVECQTQGGANGIKRGQLWAQPSVALLKGRHNYLCPYYLDRALQSPQFSLSGSRSAPLKTRLLMNIQRWSRQSLSGDLSAFNGSIDKALRPFITSTAESCLGNNCPHFQRCPLLKARARALAADIVVINHHLLAAALDFASNDGSGGDYSGQLLKKIAASDAVIVDEAHQLLAPGQQLFARRLASWQLTAFCRDADLAVQEQGAEFRQLSHYIEAFAQAIKRLRNNPAKLDFSVPLQCIAVVDGLQASFANLQASFAQIATSTASCKYGVK